LVFLGLTRHIGASHFANWEICSCDAARNEYYVSKGNDIPIGRGLHREIRHWCSPARCRTVCHIRNRKSRRCRCARLAATTGLNVSRVRGGPHGPGRMPPGTEHRIHMCLMALRYQVPRCGGLKLIASAQFGGEPRPGHTRYFRVRRALRRIPDFLRQLGFLSLTARLAKGRPADPSARRDLR
jgi:hypothetical protein